MARKKVLKEARQGDVYFERITKLPKGLKLYNSPILAHGEVTGHAHKVDSVSFDNCDIFVDEQGNLFLENKTNVDVVHDEHGTIGLSKGMYKVGRQREFDPLNAMRERRVQD